MPSSSTTNSSMTNNDRKRRGVSLSNTKKIRRSQLINNSKNERSLSISDSHQYSLTTENNLLRQFNDSYDKDNNNVRRDIGMLKLIFYFFRIRCNFILHKTCVSLAKRH